MSACGYEVVRTITSQYSIVSRMEAVYVRDSALKLFQSVGGIKRPTDLIRHLEDAFAKSESKLTNFPELKLSEADRCSVLLQSLSAEVRQYVVLHGKSDDWEALRKSLTYYEEQLRLGFDFATSLVPQEPSATSFVTTVGRRDTRQSSAGRRSATRELQQEVLERATATTRRKEKDVATRRRKVLARPVVLKRAKATKEKARKGRKRARTSGRKAQRGPRSTRKGKTRDAP